MQIHQLQLSYVAAEDRILLRVSTVERDEIRIWLTRRFTAGIVPVLRRCTEHLAEYRLAKNKSPNFTVQDAYVRRSMAEFEAERHLSAADFKTPFVEQSRQVLLGGQTMLPAEAQVTPFANGLTRIVLKGEPQPITIELNEQLLHALLRLLTEVQASTEWGLDLRLPASPPPADEAAPEKRLLN
jgi:hypothetical protein